MLLEIAEKIIRRNGFEQKKKKPGLSANQAFEQLRPLASVFKLQALETSHTISRLKPSKRFHNETQF